MKKLYPILIFLMTGFFAKAQEEPVVPPEKKQQNIEALKVAFISKELELTPEEAQRFWPVYNQYAKEISTTIKSSPDIIDREEKILNIRKHYRDQFTQVLGPDRMNRLFNAEGKFRQILIKSLRRQQMMNNMQNRPFMRNGIRK